MAIPPPTSGSFAARGRAVVLCLCVLSAVLLASGAALAQDPATQAEPALGEAMQSKDEAPETFDQWMRLAAQGDPKAQCNVGVYYINGQSVPLNVRQGVAWLRRSAEQGFSYAQYLLAELYTSGESDLEADTPEAFFWASLSAAATDLPEKVHRKVRKLRDLNQDRLTQEQIRAVQDKAAKWWEAFSAKP